MGPNHFLNPFRNVYDWWAQSPSSMYKIAVRVLIGKGWDCNNSVFEEKNSMCQHAGILELIPSLLLPRILLTFVVSFFDHPPKLNYSCLIKAMLLVPIYLLSGSYKVIIGIPASVLAILPVFATLLMNTCRQAVEMDKPGQERSELAKILNVQVSSYFSTPNVIHDEFVKVIKTQFDSFFFPQVIFYRYQNDDNFFHEINEIQPLLWLDAFGESNLLKERKLYDNFNLQDETNKCFGSNRKMSSASFIRRSFQNGKCALGFIALHFDRGGESTMWYLAAFQGNWKGKYFKRMDGGKLFFILVCADNKEGIEALIRYAFFKPSSIVLPHFLTQGYAEKRGLKGVWCCKLEFKNSNSFQKALSAPHPTKEKNFGVLIFFRANCENCLQDVVGTILRYAVTLFPSSEVDDEVELDNAEKFKADAILPISNAGNTKEFTTFAPNRNTRSKLLYSSLNHEEDSESEKKSKIEVKSKVDMDATYSEISKGASLMWMQFFKEIKKKKFPAQKSTLDELDMEEKFSLMGNLSHA